MAICETHIWQIVRMIEPSQAQKEGAQRSHVYLRDILATGNMAARIKTSYLSGSYARDTAIRPIDDVDVIFLVDPAPWQTPLESLLQSLPSPSRVLETFANAIRYRYPVSSVYGQRRSVRLQLFHLDVDVVPAVPTTKPREWKIPDAKADDWILTAPLKHAESATEVNKMQDGKLKPLVKLLKLWNGNLPETSSFKSFTIETMAVRLFRTTTMESLQQGLLYFFDFVTALAGQNSVYQWPNKAGMSLGWFGAQVPDAAETGSNTAAGVDDERRKRFVEHATRSRDRMSKSFAALTPDTAYQWVSQALKM